MPNHPEKTDLDKAFEKIEAYAESLDRGHKHPDDTMVQRGLFLIAQVLAYGFQALITLREKGK